MKQYKATLTKEELNAHIAENFEGEISVVNTIEEAEEAVKRLREEQFIGFDTETRPSFVKGESHNVSLLQLSGESKCYLFRLNLIGMPDCLVKLLRSRKIKKIGLSTKDDFRALSALKSDLRPCNFVELQSYVSQFGIEEKSLSKVYAIVFGKRISKGQRLSNWEAEELGIKQQQYAALDAWATRRIYEELEKQHDTEIATESK
ncbi:MAG: 3'-5' exonuclease domain-containing protein 2 [Paludibacteraceae bacterium]|nr:3'-5' exonuclease domain-containing protein 2 [Candidatus Physcocola equi]MCQ2235246.1 3'-5' exonuclease domain-containing protein 2 [Paludibacteraceae bacterium]